MPPRITWLVTATGSLVAACLGVPSRLAEARRCAMELAERRSILVQTEVATDGGKQVVLRTRIRIIGDTQTDVLGSWMHRANPDSAQATIHAHFHAVAARAGDLSSLRTLGHAIQVGSWLGLAVLALQPVLPVLETQDWTHLLPMVLEHWHWPLAGIVLPLVHWVARWVLRRRLRGAFSRGLTSA